MPNTLEKKCVYGYCRLQREMEMLFNYTWEIPKFRETYDKILPQKIVIEDQPFQFYLTLCQDGSDPYYNVTNLVFHIYSVTTYSCIYSIYLSDTCIHKNVEFNITSNTKYSLFTIRINDVKKLCRIDGSLTINLNCEFYNSLSQTTMCTTTLESYEIVEQNNDMIFDEKSLVIFVIGHKRLYANKNLICKNIVFKAMFDCDMKESKTNEVQIIDDEYDILKMLLTYIQFSAIPNFNNVSTETIVELLIIANKYNEEDLKSLCELRLIKLINNENCKKFYNEAWIDNTKYLKKYVQQFIQIRSNIFDSELTAFIKTDDELSSRNTTRFKFDKLSCDIKMNTKPEDRNI